MSDHRYGTTKRGKRVVLNLLTPVAGGWEGYVIGSQGHAVRIFVPDEIYHPGFEL